MQRAQSDKVLSLTPPESFNYDNHSHDHIPRFPLSLTPTCSQHTNILVGTPSH